MVELSPSAQAWAVASSLGDPAQSVFAPSRIDELLEGFGDTGEELLDQVPARASGLERTLWIFSELLRDLPPYSEPMNFAFVTEEERRRLSSHFADTYWQCVSKSFTVMPSRSAQWQLTEDYANGHIWWTTPSVETGWPVNFYVGQVLSPVLSEDLPLFGSLPAYDLFFEGDYTEVSMRMSRWKATDTSGMRLLDPKDLQRDIGKVLKIENATDFVDLTEAYPLHADCKQPNNCHTWKLYGYEVLPNWAAISRDYFGVSLSARAYLDSAWTPLPTRHGMTRMSGWIPEVIYLLKNPWHG